MERWNIILQSFMGNGYISLDKGAFYYQPDGRPDLHIRILIALPGFSS